jgi:NADPH:quinone reductase
MYDKCRIWEPSVRAVVMSEPSPGPDRTGIRAIDPPRPGPGQVSIDVQFAGINFIDVMARRGDPGYATAWPYVPGMEVAGTVRAAGPGVTAAVPGQRVAAFTSGGGLAEVAVADANLVVPVPDGAELAVAAAAPLMGSTALLLLGDVARVRPGETVLMHSAGGGVGGAVGRLAPLLGADPLIGTVGRPAKADQARAGGWRHIIVRGPGLACDIRAAAPAGADVILDPSGTALLETDLAAAAPGGRIVLFGNPGGGAPGSLPPLGRLIGGNVSIAGFSMSRLTAAAPARAAAALRRVLDLVAAGQLDLPVTAVVPLGQVPSIQQRLADGDGSGKYVAAIRP